MSEEEQICIALRQVQCKSGCATRTLNLVIKELQPFLRCTGFESTWTKPDKSLHNMSGAKSVQLHGCVGCHKHVFGPSDRSRGCPRCQHPRFDADNNPNEVCWYFPLRDKLYRLTKLPQFRHLLRYQARRLRRNRYYTDVFDSPRWHRIIGSRRGLTIVLHFCVDGIPAFSYGGLSVKPAEFLILNLPPALRSVVRNMLLFMLVPAHLKDDQARKYYDWAATEINDLHVRGVNGIRVIVYGTTLDAPGNAEIYQMESHSAYYGCPHCYHKFAPGLWTKPVYGGFRCFLPRGHPLRQRTFVINGLSYQFSTHEGRTTPAKRINHSVAQNIAMATPRKPFRGHKSPPLLSRWIGYSWEMQVCDIMHDVKNVCTMMLKIIVGQGRKGMYSYWKAGEKDSKHRIYCRVHNIFPDVHDDTNPLPWRLTGQDVDDLDNRIKHIYWPHYMDVLLCNESGDSFWKESSACWKSRHKAMIFMVSTNQLKYLTGHVIVCLHMTHMFAGSVADMFERQSSCCSSCFIEVDLRSSQIRRPGCFTI